MWGKRGFNIFLEKNAILDFEKIMLSSGECNIFMQMTFISERGGERASYYCSGFAPVSSYIIEKTEDALYILESALLILGRAAEFLIAPAKVLLTADTVFYNKETTEVKIAYIPVKEQPADLRKNIALFIKQLKTEICDGKAGYLEQAARYVCYHNYYLRDMVNKVGEMKQQIYLQETDEEEKR